MSSGPEEEHSPWDWSGIEREVAKLIFPQNAVEERPKYPYQEAHALVVTWKETNLPRMTKEARDFGRLLTDMYSFCSMRY